MKEPSQPAQAAAAVAGTTDATGTKAAGQTQSVKASSSRSYDSTSGVSIRLPTTPSSTSNNNRSSSSNSIGKAGNEDMMEPPLTPPSLGGGAPAGLTGAATTRSADLGTPAARVADASLATNAASSIGTAGAAAADDDDDAPLDTQGYTSQVREKGEAAKARCLQVLAGFNQAFLTVVQDTPGEALVEHGLFIRPADKMSAGAYGKGRVVILGDAAHPVRPTGEGVVLGNGGGRLEVEKRLEKEGRERGIQ
jgi:hypothetical protein